MRLLKYEKSKINLEIHKIMPIFVIEKAKMS